MKGILKKTEAGWFVLYQVMRDEITSGYDSIPLHPMSHAEIGPYNLYDGKEVEFEVIMDKPDHRYSETPYAKTINEDADDYGWMWPTFIRQENEDELGCSYPECICQGDEINNCSNRTPDQVVLGNKTALVEDTFQFQQGFVEQTAVQQLINEIVEHLTYDDDLTADNRTTLETIRLRCLNKLSVEKEQIINAFKDAQVLHITNGQIRGEQYYNKKYGK
jgi:hypothetical protein